MQEQKFANIKEGILSATTFRRHLRKHPKDTKVAAQCMETAFSQVKADLKMLNEAVTYNINVLQVPLSTPK